MATAILKRVSSIMELLGDGELRLQFGTAALASSATTVLTTDFGYVQGVLLSWESKPTTEGMVTGARSATTDSSIDIKNDGGSGNGTVTYLAFGK